MATKYDIKKVLAIILADKGGVGKSFIAQVVHEMLTGMEGQRNVSCIDSDVGNSSTKQIYRNAEFAGIRDANDIESIGVISKAIQDLGDGAIDNVVWDTAAGSEQIVMKNVMPIVLRRAAKAKTKVVVYRPITTSQYTQDGAVAFAEWAKDNGVGVVFVRNHGQGRAAKFFAEWADLPEREAVTCMRQGKTACGGRSIPMAKLDSLVTENLIDRLFSPDRLTAILASVVARRAEKSLEVDRRVSTLQTEVTEAEEKLKRLYKMVEEGLTDLDDILKDRLASLKLDRDRAKTALERIRSQSAMPTAFSTEAIERFSRAMRENITSGEVPFRKAYIQSVVDRIEVDDGVIRIIGDKPTLEQAISGNAVAGMGVRRCVPKWRTRQDSNLWPLPSEGSALSS